MTTQSTLMIDGGWSKESDCHSPACTVTIDTEAHTVFFWQHGVTLPALALRFDDLAAIVASVDAARKAGETGQDGEQQATWPPNWSEIPLEFDKAAVSAFGYAYAYSGEVCLAQSWWCSNSPCLYIGRVTLPPGQSWRDSLCERHTIQPK
jgi:hypothetical protein